MLYLWTMDVHSNSFEWMVFRHGYYQEVTPRWKAVHWIWGYQGYQPDIRGTVNGYQEKIDHISIKYLTDFSRVLKKYICWIYLNISQISVDSGQRVKQLEKSLKTAIFDRIPQPDIKALCTQDIVSCHLVDITMYIAWILLTGNTLVLHSHDVMKCQTRVEPGGRGRIYHLPRPWVITQPYITVARSNL